MLGAIIAWTVAGAGMLMLAFVFQRLAMRKPRSGRGHLRLREGGIRRLRRVQFGDRVLGVRLRGQHVLLGPHHGNDERGGARVRRGRHGARVIVSAIGVWLFAFLVLRGVKDAAVINYIVTIAKVVPILVFIVIAIIAFKADVFADNFWGDGGLFVLRRCGTRPPARC